MILDNILNDNTKPIWEDLVAILVLDPNNLAVSTIVEKTHNLSGYEFLLRVASQSKHLDIKTRELLLSNDKLDPRFRKILLNKNL